METQVDFNEVQNRVTEGMRTLEAVSEELSCGLQELAMGFQVVGADVERLRHLIGDIPDEGQPEVKAWAYQLISWKRGRLSDASQHLQAALVAFSEACREACRLPTDAEVRIED